MREEIKKDDKAADEMEKYLADLREMKALVDRHEEKPVVEYWDFISWGLLIMAGTLLHARYFSGDLNRGLLAVWLPVFLVGGLVETFAWLYLVRRMETPLSLRRNLRFYLAAMVILIALIFILYFVIHLEGPVAGILLLLLTILMTLVALATYMALFVETVIVLISGIILCIIDPPGTPPLLASGIIAGLSFIALGIHSRILEKRNSGNAGSR